MLRGARILPLIDYLGAEDNPHTRAVMRKSLRQRYEGFRHTDHMPILAVTGQGIGKSNVHLI